MDNSLLAVRGINHKYIVVEKEKIIEINPISNYSTFIYLLISWADRNRKEYK